MKENEWDGMYTKYEENIFFAFVLFLCGGLNLFIHCCIRPHSLVGEHFWMGWWGYYKVVCVVYSHMLSLYTFHIVRIHELLKNGALLLSPCEWVSQTRNLYICMWELKSEVEPINGHKIWSNYSKKLSSRIKHY